MRIPLFLLVPVAVAGCGLEAPADLVTTRGSALTQALAPRADTFVNSAVPDNNSGASPSIYTGENGQMGLMRGLLAFTLPAALQGRATVTRVTLTMTTRGTGIADATPPTPATESLQAVTVPWVEGVGFGDSMQNNTVGQPCGTTGATWNQPDCAGGTPWTGGTAAGAVSGTASVPGTSETAVVWDSDAAGNAGMVADVQAWLDAPAGNLGWRISSSTEGTTAAAQRFHSREVAGKGPSLSVTLACKPGFGETDGGCTTASASDGAAPTDGGPPPSGDGGGGCSCSVSRQTGPGRELAAAFVAILLLAVARPARAAAARSRPSSARTLAPRTRTNVACVGTRDQPPSPSSSVASVRPRARPV